MYEVFGDSIRINDNLGVCLLGKHSFKIGSKLKDDKNNFFEILSIGMPHYTDSANRNKYTDLFLKPIDNAETVGNTLYSV